MIEGQPFAYIRRSFSRRHDPGDISREFQVAEVRRLAGTEAERLTIKDKDWGVSASREATHRRLDFLDLLDRISRGEVSTLYAYSADRLARSVRWSAQLLDACEDAGTTIVTREGSYAPRDASARMMFSFNALMNENALVQMKSKAASTIDERKKNGDHLGPPVYGKKVVGGKLVDNPAENVEMVIKAYRDAGTVHGAATLLNRIKVPTRSGKPWRATTVRGILDRERVLPRRPTRGRPAKREYLFAKILRCHCGGTMTGRKNTKGRRGFAYECKRAPLIQGHGPYSISEARLLPIIRAEADRLLTPEAVRMGDQDTEARRTELEERRDRVTDTYLDVRARKTKAWRDAEFDDIDRELDRLAVIDTIQVVPRLDWSWPVAQVNSILALIFERIDLGPDLLPVPNGFRWLIPEWRRGGN